MQTERIREIIGRFDTAGTVADLRAVGNGWINDTYRVMTVSDETPDYILQRINHHVFKDVELLQRNIERVTSHIRRKLAAAVKQVGYAVDECALQNLSPEEQRTLIALLGRVRRAFEEEM